MSNFCCFWDGGITPRVFMISAKKTLSWKVFIMVGTLCHFQWLRLLMAFTIPSSPPLFRVWKNHYLMLRDRRPRLCAALRSGCCPFRRAAQVLRQQRSPAQDVWEDKDWKKSCKIFETSGWYSHLHTCRHSISVPQFLSPGEDRAVRHSEGKEQDEMLEAQ